jgi:hypothetical protein
MAITVTPTYEDVHQNITGALLQRATLVVTGLTAAEANTIPHGLPRIPYGVPNYQATSGTPGFETSVPTATDLFYTTGAGQTSLRIGVEY